MKTLSLLLVLFAQSVFAADPTAFIESFRTAHGHHDLDALMALVEFDETTPKELKDLKRESFRTQIALSISEISIVPLTADDVLLLTSLTKEHATTLVPQAKFIVKFQRPAENDKGGLTAMTSFLGIKDDKYRIVAPKKKG